jgi:hypothetical protein
MLKALDMCSKDQKPLTKGKDYETDQNINLAHLEPVI